MCSAPLQPAPAVERRPIRRLPSLVVNQIAAGEVIERPASVVKELVDNALDAGATRIDVELEAGGIELVAVSDDGAGIPPGELPLALAPHATSKISVAEDLDRVATMGFRGEALASIAAVSRLSIRSRVAAEPAAAMIDAEGDAVSEARPASGPVGTRLAVRNLFFNTPARRKFLRTPATEQAHAVEFVRGIAMSHHAIAFSVTADGRRVVDLAATDSPRRRIMDVLGRELEEHLLEVRADQFDDARGVSLWGLVGAPAIARPTAKAQHIYLNGRPIRDKTIQHAIREAYRGLIEPGRYPTAVVMLEMSPAGVDVNVHPAKIEVRFRDQSQVHTVVLRAVREALRAADLVPEIHLRASPSAALFGPGATPGMTTTRPADERLSAADLDRFVSFLRRPASVAAAIQRPSAPSPNATYAELRDAVAEPTITTPTESSAESAGESPPVADEQRAHDRPSPADADSLPVARASLPILQVHNSYVVTQDEHGLVIVDQHALHERVMFEALLARVSASPLESQRLIVPVTVAVSPAQLQKLPSLKPLFERIGIEADAMGPTTLGVHAFPTILFDRGVDAGEFLTDILERFEAESLVPSGEEALHELLDMMACKAAIKAGDRLAPQELRDLLEYRDAIERSTNCPHGRPTSLRLTISELDRRFGRS